MAYFLDLSICTRHACIDLPEEHFFNCLRNDVRGLRDYKDGQSQPHDQIGDQITKLRQVSAIECYDLLWKFKGTLFHKLHNFSLNLTFLIGKLEVAVIPTM